MVEQPHLSKKPTLKDRVGQRLRASLVLLDSRACVAFFPFFFWGGGGGRVGVELGGLLSEKLQTFLACDIPFAVLRFFCLLQRFAG